MSQNIIENFERYFPRMANRARRYEEVGYKELFVLLVDGDCLLYDDVYNVIRSVPKTEEGISEDEYRREFGYRMTRMMECKCISQMELSNRTGISKRTLSLYMNGRATPSVYKANKIARALDCRLDDLEYIKNYY